MLRDIFSLALLKIALIPVVFQLAVGTGRAAPWTLTLKGKKKELLF